MSIEDVLNLLRSCTIKLGLLVPCRNECLRSEHGQTSYLSTELAFFYNLASVPDIDCIEDFVANFTKDYVQPRFDLCFCTDSFLYQCVVMVYTHNDDLVVVAFFPLLEVGPCNLCLFWVSTLLCKFPTLTNSKLLMLGFLLGTNCRFDFFVKELDIV